MNQEKVMKQIRPGELHVVIVSREQDSAVGLFYTRDPMNWLSALASHGPLRDVEVRPARAAAQVVERLRGHFSLTHLVGAALPWYQVDFEQAIAALSAVNLDTGAELIRCGVGDPVSVRGERGKVIGYTRGGEIVVKIDRAPIVANLMIAARADVKPVVRTTAIAEAAE